ncbi:MAG: ABC transporter ATP-binding protein [Burkholderiaceae bacterium]|nr:ABC transporter ATP-binding protein [Burkholderiaceae bacterium]
MSRDDPARRSGGDPPLLETRALSLHAAGRCLLRGLDWRVRRGERWCVIGRNASGKSTLLRALAGLSVPERDGEVCWLGRRQDDWAAADAAWARAYAPQQSVDRFPLSVQRLLELSTVRPGPQAAGALLAALDAQPLARRGVMQLSGGERQRVALAQCALQGAPLMLMDEPVSFQDPAHQIQVARWLAQLVAPGSDAALVVSAHDVNWIARTATHVLALVGDGRWQAGPATELLQAGLLAQVYGCGWTEVGGVWVAT